MSPDPTISPAPDSIDHLLRQANADALAGGLDDRARALAIEANQRMMEYMDELIDAPPASFDLTVTVRCEGVTMKFPDIDKMSAWLAAWKEW